MKVKDFLASLDNNILAKIDTLSGSLNAKRTFVQYEDFEDIVWGDSLETIKLNIKPTTRSLPSYLMERVQ